MNLTQKDEDLINQIYWNMVERNILEEPDNEEEEGIDKSELRVLAHWIKKRAYEEISDLLLQKSLDGDTLKELEAGK